MNAYLDQFRRVLESRGLIAPAEIIADGKIHRCDAEGKHGRDDGAYLLHLDGIPAGGVQNHRDGLGWQNWRADIGRRLTPAEEAAHRERVQAMQAQREQEEAQARQAAAARAAKLWERAHEASVDHPYLVRKGIGAHGLHQHDGALLVPVCDVNSGELASVQRIAPDGSKRFLPGGRTRGCAHLLGELPAAPAVLLVGEGYATAASLYEATGHPVACAFHAGNLAPVAGALRKRYPAARLVVCADDDCRTAGNPGMSAARQAAAAVGGVVAVPDFGPDRPEGASDFNDLAQAQGLEAVAACIDVALAAPLAPAFPAQPEGSQDWPELRELKQDLPNAPPFDAQAMLPKALADFVLDEADRLPCPPDYIAAPLLVALGSVIGARSALKPKRRDDWLVTPNLFGGVVGDPSSKKSPALSVPMRFLDRLEAKSAEALEAARGVYAAELAAFEAHESAVRAAMKKAASGKPDAEKMELAIYDLQALQKPEEPHQRRFKTNDGTIEKLGELLSKNPQGLLVFRDELTALLSSWEREGHETDRAFYLEGWNGTGSFSIDRITRGSVFVQNLCLSVFGGIQPELLARYLSAIANAQDNDGRVQRFQVLVYPEPVPWEWRDKYPVKGAREAVRDIFDRLTNFDPVADGATPADEFVKLPAFSFDDAAQELFIEWCHELHTTTIANEPHPMLRQHFGKYEKLFCAVALILHLAEGNIGNVKVESTLRAAAWCEYLAGHARRVYGLIESQRVSSAQLVARRIAEGKLQDGFTARELGRKQWAGIVTAADAEAALALLEEHGFVRAVESVTPTGRPTTAYIINPAAKRSAP